MISAATLRLPLLEMAQPMASLAVQGFIAAILPRTRLRPRKRRPKCALIAQSRALRTCYFSSLPVSMPYRQRFVQKTPTFGDDPRPVRIAKKSDIDNGRPFG